MNGGENYEQVYKSPDSFYFDEQAGVFTKCLINGVQFCAPVPLRDPMAHCDKFYYLNENQNNQYIIQNLLKSSILANILSIKSPLSSKS